MSAEQPSITCPDCNGAKTVTAHVNTGPDSSKHYWTQLPCDMCNGQGEITKEHARAVTVGFQMRKARIAAGETCKEAADRLGISPSELSARERPTYRRFYAEEKEAP